MGFNFHHITQKIILKIRNNQRIKKNIRILRSMSRKLGIAKISKKSLSKRLKEAGKVTNNNDRWLIKFIERL
jgi:hypothetical protein